MRKNRFVHLVCSLVNAKICLAFSSIVVDDEGGLSFLKCPVSYDLSIRFVPFTDNELKQYLDIHNQTYAQETTLPLVVHRCLVSQDGDCYDTIVCRDITTIIGSIIHRLSTKNNAASELLTALFNFCIMEDKCCDMRTLTLLLDTGLIYSMGSAHKLVYDRKLMLSELTSCLYSRFLHP